MWIDLEGESAILAGTPEDDSEGGCAILEWPSEDDFVGGIAILKWFVTGMLQLGGYKWKDKY